MAGWERGVARRERGVAGQETVVEQDMHLFQQHIECPVLCLQAERIMEAVELCREEQAKLAEHKEKCAAARKEVGA